jgi:predicted Zn finger-like uncharacterized protein
MSLITRCPACGTMFKVVADQLKISQGWVRCGQCAEVFDAAAQLQPRAPRASSVADSGADAQPAPWEGQLDADSSAQPASLVPAPAPETPDPAALPTDEVALATAAAEAAALTLPVSLPEVQVSLPPDMAADVFASAMSPEPYGFPIPARSASQPDSAFGQSPAPEPEDMQDVSFVRDARRQAFWRRPVMRVLLGLAALVLLAGLLLQLALFQRHALAERQPWLSPALHTLCQYLHCEIRPPQQIEAVVIDSSSFNKIGADSYRLKVVIKNTGPIPLAMPALELTLTDTQEQALLRRVLAPGEFGATAATLAAGAEFSGVVAIRISNPVPAASASPASAARPFAPLRIAGYRVLAFYP